VLITGIFAVVLVDVVWRAITLNNGWITFYLFAGLLACICLAAFMRNKRKICMLSFLVVYLVYLAFRMVLLDAKPRASF